MSSKTPTKAEKILVYENFLHNINKAIKTHNCQLITKLLQNADTWSHVQNIQEIKLSKKEKQNIINKAFWNLTK